MTINHQLMAHAYVAYVVVVVAACDAFDDDVGDVVANADAFCICC